MMSNFGIGGSAVGSQELPGSEHRTHGTKVIALLGDTSDHGGTVVSANQDDDSLSVGGVLVALHGALHSCPIEGHGVTELSAVTLRSMHNDKLILTIGAVAGCGARLTPIDRGVYVE